MVKVKTLLSGFDRISSPLAPYVPTSPGIENFYRRQQEREMYERAARRQKQKEYQKLEQSLVSRTDFPVQLNSRVTITMEDRWAVIGMSGSGKTTWVRQLIPRIFAWYQVPIIILDTKGQGEFDDIADELSITDKPPKPIVKPAVQVWKPPLDDIDAYDQFLSQILKNRKPALVVVDELSNLGKGNADSYPNGYRLLLKQGRGLKISTVSMVQEAAYIPRQTTGQTSHLLRFHLLNDYDKLKMARMMGLPDSMRYSDPPDQHGFYYRRMDRPTPVYYFYGWQEFFPPMPTTAQAYH